MPRKEFATQNKRKVATRNLLSVMSLFIVNVAAAQYSYTPYADARNENLPREDAKLLREIEKTFRTITVYSPDVSTSRDVDSFWDNIRAQTPSYNEYMYKIEAENRFAIKVRKEFYKTMPPFVHPAEASPRVAFLSGSEDPLSDIMERDSYYLNSSVDPYGNIEITTGLLEILEQDEITAILAHETAHHKLKHIERENYNHKKRERSNEIVAGIAAGVSAAANGYAAGASGTNVDYNAIHWQTESFFESAKDGALRYKFYTSRENELEADIAAIRFLQYNGIAPITYVHALEKIMSYSFDQTDSTGVRTNSRNAYDTHPSLLFRIKALYCILEEEGIAGM